MRAPTLTRGRLEEGGALLAGLVLAPLLAFLDRGAGSLVAAVASLGGFGPPSGLFGLFPSVLVEESAKFALLALFALFVRPRARGISLGLVAIVVFSATESLSYVLAFPGGGLLARLGWSNLVHLTTALALAGSLGDGARKGSRTEGRPSSPRAGELGVAFTFALLWHLGANFLASRAPGAATVLAFSLVNAAAFLLLARRFFDRVISGGLHDGTASA